MSQMPKLAGYRNLLSLMVFLGWGLVVMWIVRPPGGYTPELVSAMSALLLAVGGVVVGSMFGRAAKSMADRWEPRRRGDE